MKAASKKILFAVFAEKLVDRAIGETVEIPREVQANAIARQQHDQLEALELQQALDTLGVVYSRYTRVIPAMLQ
ncbi:hypothetical protein QS306_12615 [Paraburkholderia bonniea]|uniref:hypothetical protein n=1 Tax=Paraburkholderia bonniea TaxID=2152891 RepID=UPI0025729B55|nr:hypothetical protein [Paraburkholderia bonniea]WJF89933.1 hypothetical protein QS306_12615 [Paraburkholderia bonniea]WJF93247.1 hypothetical protein QS308_12625 [Paraburkholderia bonniea]